MNCLQKGAARYLSLVVIFIVLWAIQGIGRVRSCIRQWGENYCVILWVTHLAPAYFIPLQPFGICMFSVTAYLVTDVRAVVDKQ